MKVALFFLAFLFMAAECDKSNNEAGKWVIGEPTAKVLRTPLFIERNTNSMVVLQLKTTGYDGPLYVDRMEVAFTDNSSLSSLESVSVYYTGIPTDALKHELLASSTAISKNTVFDGNVRVGSGTNIFVLDFKAAKTADLTGKIGIGSVKIVLSNGVEKTVTMPADSPVIRFGQVLRAAGQDGSDTYRIPGLVTTNAGTLIAVYDIRYNGSGDLQGNIDIGMSRSSDGGATWEPMKVIMDMGQWGGKPEAQNGVGDPCVLVDRITGTI